MNQQFEARDTYAFRLNEWYDKTKWVQETVQPGERDMHRADIIKLRFQQVEAQRDALLEALRWIATVHAVDYEYQAKARAAIAKAEREKDWPRS